jgi:hypothetical protein
MAKRQFAIEPPRRISIRIEGYQPGAQTRRQQRRQQQRGPRNKRPAEAAGKPHAASAALAANPLEAERPDAADELEALNRAAAYRPPRAESEEDLRAAFNEGEGLVKR